MDPQQETIDSLQRLASQPDAKTAESVSLEIIAADRQQRRTQRQVDSLSVLYAVAVWGHPYVDVFLTLSLPSLLAEGNLEDLPNNKNSRFIIHTLPEDRPFFEATSQFQALKRMMPISFHDISLRGERRGDKYDILNRCQSEAIAASEEFDAIVFTYADFVWATGTIRSGLARIADGYDAAVMPVPPLVREDLIEFAIKNFDHLYDFIRGYPRIGLSPRRLVALGKPLMHPLMRDSNLDYRLNTTNAAYTSWFGPNGDLLIRCFHIHPLILRVQRENPDFWIPLTGTLDEDFIPRVLAAPDRVYHVADSDEAAAASLTPRNFPLHYFPENDGLDAAKIARWAEGSASPLHKMFFDSYSIWHEHDVSWNEWEPTIARSQRIANFVKWTLLMPDTIASYEIPVNWLLRANRSTHQRKKSWLRYLRLLPARTLQHEFLLRIRTKMPETLRTLLRPFVPRNRMVGGKAWRTRDLPRAPLATLLVSIMIAALNRQRSE
jgi:hypothetical protein